MKKVITLILFGLLLGSVSCTKEKVPVPITATPNPDLETDNWRIIYFWDAHEEEAYHFENCVWTFLSGDSLRASHPDYTYYGSWHKEFDKGEELLIIEFDYPSDFEELDEEWTILTITDTQIQLRTDAGSNQFKFVTFERIK